VPVSPRKARVACSISLILLLANCGDNPTGPGDNKPGIRAVAGAGVTDTVDAQLLHALVVEVRGENGALASGVAVRFEPDVTADPFGVYDEPSVRVCTPYAPDCAGLGLVATEITDAHGRAQVPIRMGIFAGRGVVRLVVPDLGLADSATFTKTPGAPAAVRAVGADPQVNIGGTATLGGRVVDRYENARTEKTILSAGPGSAITLDPSTGTVTGREMGNQWVLMRYNALVDSGRVRVVPPGRLLVWGAGEPVVRLVNLDGSAERTILTNVAISDDAFPQFDPTRQRITLHVASENYGLPNTLIVIDTTGASRRDIGPAIGFSTILANRYLADGTVLVVATRSSDPSHPGYSLWRVATDNTITFVVALPGLGRTHGGADVSHDGTRVAYISSSSSPNELRLLDVASGSTSVLDGNANSPRWSAQDDRIVYLTTALNVYNDGGGSATVINTNGSGRKVFGSYFSPGMAWSPDGVYVVGRASDETLRLVRVSDGTAVELHFLVGSVCCHDYFQPDWR
jgi:hypothetical protein